MALLLKTMANKYAYAMREMNDKRTEHWFLIDSPIPTIFLLACYLLFVFEIGPNYMKNRKPFNIDKILIAFNAVQVVICLYTWIYLTPYIFVGDFTCQVIDYSPESTPIAEMAYVYYWTKILDLFDTVFFILRKKNNQVSFLHVYHHSIMVAYVWYGVKYVAGGQLIFIGVINSFVHVVMYMYYLLTAYDAEYKKSVWWKKHITQLQLVQFGAIAIWIFLPMLSYDCKFPKTISMVLFPQVLTITCLFADFYYKTYIKKRPVKITENKEKLDANQNIAENVTPNKSKLLNVCNTNI